MSEDIAKQLYSRTDRRPWREIFGYKWLTKSDSSLVVRDFDGRYFMLGRRGDPVDSGGPAAMIDDAPEPSLRGDYADSFRVDVTEHVDSRAVGIPTVYGTESVDVWVSWWVHDPVQVVRTRTMYGWHQIRTHLSGILRQLADAQTEAGSGLGAPEIMRHLGVTQRMAEAGLSYRVFDIRLRDSGEELLLGQQENEWVRFSWTNDRRGEYDFCLQALRAGPVSLAALWLLRHPDQVQQVLDWSVGHQDLLGPAHTDWQEELASLLGTLTDQERKEISSILRDRIAALGRQVPGVTATRK
ncbi:hypothetical protein GCM10010387_34130 [Streptomyces inusitatus]|uniref:Uncharacterized protein n=1 Tax=Streptomyces inusitatus TaxID=68221 RepID=A0A918UUW1_9ACTN|nr:hypothetical protein [Streptomyces inusitatus]GGZ37198.1 hypothetical protein GCM10010387_34130 [Streptomyces inusitatus]